MKPIAGLIAVATALGATAVALGQPLNQAAPQPQKGPATQPDVTPPPPSPSDPSMTTMQQPISGNSSATNPPNSMAPNSAAPTTHLAALLPRGMSQKEACSGFKTTEECAAALHAAQNLNLSFTDLKSSISGGQRLAAAIHTLKPDADANAEAQRAEQQAHSDLKPPQG